MVRTGSNRLSHKSGTHTRPRPRAGQSRTAARRPGNPTSTGRRKILSPEDTYADTHERAADYHHMGVQTIWIIDPHTKTSRMCIGATWTEASRLEVPGTPIYVELAEIFARMNG